jgi:hypothetical protein
MPRLSKQDKEDIRQLKGKTSVGFLVEKYGVSKATIHRVLADSKVSFDKSSTDHVEDSLLGQEFVQVLNGKEEAVEVPETNEVDRNATERLAEAMFMEEEKLEGMEDFVVAEDPVQRNAVIQRIMLNIDNFAPMFSFIHNKEEFVKSLHSKSLVDLEGILKTMETTRTTINLSNQMKQTFLMVAKGTEVLGNQYLNLKTDGFTAQLVAQKQELDMIFRELAIDYAPRFTFQTRPEVRLVMLYGMTLLQTDNNNRIKDFIEARSKVEVPEASTEKFGDL